MSALQIKRARIQDRIVYDKKKKKKIRRPGSKRSTAKRNMKSMLPRTFRDFIDPVND